MERLSGLDANFLYNETPTLHMHTLKLAVLDAALTADEITREYLRDQVSLRLRSLPPFRRRLVPIPGGFHHPVWIEDPDFDLDYHLRFVSVDEPGGRVEMDRAIGSIASTPLDRRRPLWELYMLEGLADGRTGVLIKIHHALADGAAASELLANAMTEDESLADGSDVVGVDPWKPEEVPSVGELLLAAFLDHLRQLAQLPGLAVRTGRGLRRASTTRKHSLIRPPRPILDTPATSFNGALTARRAFASATIPLDQIKEVKNRHGVTLNDVVLALVGGGLRSYLLDRDELPQRSLTAAVPVGTDSAGLPPRLGGNAVSNIFTTLGTDIEDLAGRLQRVHEVTKAAKTLHDDMGHDLMADWVAYTPPGPYSAVMRYYSRHRLAEWHRSPVNVVVSNVPGPRVPLYAAGARLKGIWSVGPILEGVGVNLTVWSYLGDLNLGILTCPDSFPEPAELAERIALVLREADSLPDDQPVRSSAT